VQPMAVRQKKVPLVKLFLYGTQIFYINWFIDQVIGLLYDTKDMNLW